MSLAKNALLALVSLVVFLLVIEGALALAGVKPVLWERDPMVGFSSRIPLYVKANRRGGLQTAHNKLAIFNLQRFRRQKPEGSYRIFCLGGSTTYGRPYADRTSFCGWLRVLLPLADDSKPWELINAGGISYASYRVAALMEELIAYDPDLFIIYTGHNEFLEARTYGSLLEASPLVLEARALLNQTRTYTALSQVVERVTGRRPGELMRRDVLPAEVDAVLDDSVGLQSYHRDDELAEAVLAHFRLNLERMIDIAGSVEAETLLVTPASNLRSCAPFKNERLDGLNEVERQSFAEALETARRRSARHRPLRALEAVDEALALDPRYPDAHYLRGQLLWDLERYDEALRAFQTALDEDVCPLRALSKTVEIVREVAEDRNVALLDWVASVQRRAAHGIAGDDFFMDHVHPTIEANRLLAIELIETLRDAGILRLGPGWTQAAIARVSEQVEASLDAGAHARALTNLAKVFGWAGRHEEAHVLALKALETVNDAETYNNAGMNALRLGRTEEAIGHYEQVIARKPKHVPALSDLGFALASLERFDEALPYLEKAVALDPRYEKARFNLGHVLAQEGRYDEAIVQLEHAIRLNPKRAEYLMVLGNVYAEKGDTDEGIALYRRALEMKPELVKAHYSLALLLDERGLAADAVTHFLAALRIAPNSPIALQKLAWILASEPDAAVRDAREAIHFAEAACRLTDHRDPDALDALAAAYAEGGRFEEAVELADRALEQLADSAAASDAADGDAERIAELRARRALYEARQPYRRSRGEQREDAPARSGATS